MTDDTTTAETDLRDSSQNAVCFWTDDRGFSFVSADGSRPVHLHKLTAYAEYGDAAFEADEIHHAIPAMGSPDRGRVRVDAPEFLIPLDADEHRRIHRQHDADGGSVAEVGGIPMLVADGGQDDGDASEADRDDNDDAASTIDVGRPDVDHHDGAAGAAAAD